MDSSRRRVCNRLAVVDSYVEQDVRRSDQVDLVAEQVELARRQLDDVELYDYVVVNDDADRAGAELESILTAERARVDARRDVIRRLLDRGSL